MGVPGLYRWLCERYPKTIEDAKEELPRWISGTRIDPDTSQPNPNGVEYDNLYLDMNGIIHPACHPEDLPAPCTEEEMYLAIFKYIDRVFNIIRPRKIMYMAVDGVAPRAKMNQQRSRRYRSAKEIEDKREEEANLREQWASQGKKLPPKKAPTWDHNVITPGTGFMQRLSRFLRYYIHDRITNDPGWKNVKVILSDASVPGEGEHKVMEFIRLQRQQKGYNANTRHAIHGKDADLIMLALATHEPHFSILRELDLNPRNKHQLTAEQMRQKQEDEQAMLRLGEEDERGPAISCPPFKLIQMNIVREYLDLDFRNVQFCFAYDQEAMIDDFVLFCFFAGNDFLPHLPSLDIHEGAIGEMIRIYKEAVTSGRITGYLCSRGNCNLERCGVLLQELGKLEDDVFRRRKQKEEGIAASRARRERDQREREAVQKRNEAAAREAIREQQVHEHYQKRPDAKTEKEKDNKSAAAALRAELMGGKKRDKDEEMGDEGVGKKVKKIKTEEGEAVTQEDAVDEKTKEETSKLAEEFLEQLKKTMQEKSAVNQEDEVKLFESGWKERYYRSKFGVDIKKDPEFPRKVVQSFMEGISWTLLYYYRGCPSWTWYYPFHYAPFASDFVGLGDLVITFPEGTVPFKPFEQLMACLPPLSKHALPPAYQKLMTDKKSPIIDFYPKDFKVDMNGKKMAWLGVALLPFIDEKRLLEVVRPLESTLEDEEREQNALGSELLLVGNKGQHEYLSGIITDLGGEFLLEASSRLQRASGEFVNDNLFGKIAPHPTAWKPGELIPSPAKRLEAIQSNACVCAKYTLPPFTEHIPQLLPGLKLPDPILSEMDHVVEGRKLLDGPPGGGRGRGGGGGGGGYGSLRQAGPPGGLQGNNPMQRMINAGLTGGPMGGHGGRDRKSVV